MTNTDSGVCSGLPGPAQAVCDLPVSIGGAVGQAAQDAVLGNIASAVASSAGWFVGRLGAVLDSTARVDVSEGWFLRQYALVFALSAILTLGLMLLSVLKEVARGDWAAALRAGTLHYLAAVLASAFAPALVYLLVRLSDAISAALITGSGRSTDAFFDTFGTAMSGLVVASPFTLLLAGLLTILAAVVLWVELLLRSAIIYVALLFAAPTFSGLVDRALWRHSKRWVYFVVSVIFAKPVVVAVLLLAAGGIGSGGQDGVDAVFSGVAMLLVAIFCVGLLFRLVPNAGDQLAGALTARREVRQGMPSTPLSGGVVAVRQSLQTHLVKAAARTSPAAVVGGMALQRLRPTPSPRPTPTSTPSSGSTA